MIRWLAQEHEDLLKGLLQEGEAVYEVSCMSATPIFIIGEKDSTQLDISGCIEDTLHRLLEAGGNAETIYAVLSAEPDDTNGSLDDDGTDTYYIDLGYVIHGFYPVCITFTGLEYKPPVCEYTLHYWDKVICSHFELPEDATDEEVLDGLHDLVGLNPEEFIVQDMKNDGSMLGAKSLLNDKETFVLMKNLVYHKAIAMA